MINKKPKTPGSQVEGNAVSTRRKEGQTVLVGKYKEPNHKRQIKNQNSNLKFEGSSIHAIAN